MASREKTVFLSALEYPSGTARQVYLESACDGDIGLRKAVDELLAAHDLPHNMLDDGFAVQPEFHEHLKQVANAWDLTTPGIEGFNGQSGSDRTGEVIGNYRLMEKIGEGGFGQVYVADQLQPIRRRVALKLLKPGMDFREVIARFEAERQALAIMDHPNIAQVFDAGTTPSGQPFFVMELVRGVPITAFCQQRRLTLQQRLQLFMNVCLAVQHAHQKGLIHRDLKPSNVLVALHDTVPVVKVIDFGVAKALNNPLTDKTIYTRFAQMIGTPMYMSPEQAEMNGLDVDTRSDIYSLGVLLYEMLTGTTPFDEKRLHTASFDEMRRIIREEDPERPSTRLLSCATTVTTDATPQRLLASDLRGDLDWVVMKALEKDRRRRYDTATEFSKDVQRYLEQQPVVARPPSATYRCLKFAKRNKVTISTAVVILLALITGTAVSTWQAVLARRAQAQAETLRQEAVEFADRLKEANVLLDNARANADEQRWDLALAQYTKATQLQPDHYLTWAGRGSFFARVGAWRAAAEDYSKALALGAPANNPAWWGVPQLCLFADDDKAYGSISQTLFIQLKATTDPAQVSLAVRSLCLTPRPPDVSKDLARRMEDILSKTSLSSGDPGTPSAGSRASLPPPPPGDSAGLSFASGKFPHRLPWHLQGYAAGLAAFRAGNYDRALELLQRVSNGAETPRINGLAYPVLAMVYHELGQPAEAEANLAAAKKVLDEWMVGLEDGQFPVPWFDILEFQILYREAQQSIRQTPANWDERLLQYEARARQRTGQ